MSDLIEQLFIAIIFEAANQACIKNCRLVRDPMLWDLDLAWSQAYQRWL